MAGSGLSGDRCPNAVGMMRDPSGVGVGVEEGAYEVSRSREDFP